MISTLYCDPSQPNHVLLRYGSTVRDLSKPKANELLAAMVELIDGQPLDAISLVNKAESFTLIRVLATIANALAYSKKIKLYSDTELVSQILPHYSKDAI